jgi:hypothetical protein
MWGPVRNCCRNPAASPTRRRAQTRCSFLVAACALRCPHAPSFPSRSRNSLGRFTRTARSASGGRRPRLDAGVNAVLCTTCMVQSVAGRPWESARAKIPEKTERYDTKPLRDCQEIGARTIADTARRVVRHRCRRRDGVYETSTAAGPKKKAISVLAVDAESEPCTAFSSIERP